MSINYALFYLKKLGCAIALMEKICYNRIIIKNIRNTYIYERT